MAEITFNLPLRKKPALFLGIWGAKGGVGKTTFTVNLAYALAEKMGRVGLLDADIDCPNVAAFLNIKEPLVGSSKENLIYPLLKGGVEVVSLGMLANEDSILWRGPLLSQAVEQLVYRVKWSSPLVVVDLPPGTSDIALTLLQDIGIDGLILLTAPSKLSLADLNRSLSAAEKLSVEVLGVVENFVGDIFPSMREEISSLAPYLGALPLSREIAHANEEGELIYKEYEVFSQVADKVVRWKDAHNH